MERYVLMLQADKYSAKKLENKKLPSIIFAFHIVGWAIVDSEAYHFSVSVNITENPLRARHF